MKQITWWMISIAVSLVLAFILLQLWSKMNEYHIEPTQLSDQSNVDTYLNNLWQNTSPEIQPAKRIKTGLFIQSLKFFSATEVSLTGYLWQKYSNEDTPYKPAKNEAGFIFPEQVSASVTEAYRKIEGDEEVIGWYFEVTLRQPFDYSAYPFDHKTVWVRLWHKNFSQNVILTPDFESYQATGVNDIFGIEENIVLGTWEREDTFFDYKLSNYDTNFGLSDYIGQQNFPELHFNIVVKRNFENAFIVYLLPLLLVAALLFASMLTISSKPDLTDKFGFSTSGFIAACSALFFVVLLAHIQLREQFAGTSIVYIEYFYILMYAILVLSTINTFLFTIHADRWSNFIIYEDNLMAKVSFWPVLLLGMILVTLPFI